MQNKNIEQGTFITISQVGKFTGVKKDLPSWGMVHEVEVRGGEKLMITNKAVDLAHCYKDSNIKDDDMTRTELQNEFKKQLPYMVNKVVCFNFDKMPKLSDVFDTINQKGLPKTKAAFEALVTKGENRTFRGIFQLDNNGNIKMSGDDYSVIDVEDNYISKNISLTNLNWFAFNNIYKCKEFKQKISL